MRYKRFRTGLSSYVFSKMMEAIYSENPTSMAYSRASHRCWEHGGGWLFKIWWGGVSQYMGGAWEEGFKYCRKIPVKEFIW